MSEPKGVEGVGKTARELEKRAYELAEESYKHLNSPPRSDTAIDSIFGQSAIVDAIAQAVLKFAAAQTLTLRAELQQAHKEIDTLKLALSLGGELAGDELAELRSRLQEAEKVLWHQVVRSHEYAPDGCSGCEQAEQMLNKEDSNAPRS